MLAVIAAGGEPPEREEFLRFAEKAGLVIAADSGLEWMRAFGYTPDVMVGDFDSTGKRTVDLFLEKHVETVTVPVEKDDTDTMLAAEYAAQHGASEVVLFGGTGGERLDHTLANFHVLAYLQNRGIPARMLDAHTEIYLAQGDAEICGSVGETVSIMPFMGNAVVTLKDGGMKYPLNHLALTDTFTGVSNRLERERVGMFVEGRVLVLRSRKA